VPLGVVDGADGFRGSTPTHLAPPAKRAGTPIRVRQRLDGWGTRFRCWLRSVGEVGVGGGEAGEVVGAEDVRGGLVEGGEIEGPGTGPDVGGEGWRTDVFGTGFRVQVGGVLKYGDSGLRPE
jgi:hypothetical protein